MLNEVQRVLGVARASTNQRILNAMQAGGIVNNRTNAVAALNKVGANERVGFTLAAVCAMLKMETSGLNIWGHDPGGTAHPPDNGNVLVTQDGYQEYVRRVDEGYGWQGVGPTQLTWRSSQVEADSIGGCWKPYFNMIIGFDILKGHMVETGSPFQGFWRFNGYTPQGEQYASAAVEIQNSFQARFNAVGGRYAE